MKNVNSIKALTEETLAGRINMRSKMILSALGDKIMTDRAIMIALDFFDANTVRPRITEMIDKKILIHYDNVLCPVTKKNVRRVKLAPCSPTIK